MKYTGAGIIAPARAIFDALDYFEKEFNTSRPKTTKGFSCLVATAISIAAITNTLNADSGSTESLIKAYLICSAALGATEGICRAGVPRLALNTAKRPFEIGYGLACSFKNLLSKETSSEEKTKMIEDTKETSEENEATPKLGNWR